ncbi:MAG: NUDIX hydrolase [Elusimicrobiota bacterium]
MAPAPYPEGPRVAAGAVVIKDGRVLLVKRRHPPKTGLWAIPGGGVRLGESLAEAAERELLEETGVRARAGEPVHTFELIETEPGGRVRYHYVVIDLMAEFAGGELSPQDDAMDARWVSPEELSGLPVTETTLDLLRNRLKFGRSGA